MASLLVRSDPHTRIIAVLYIYTECHTLREIVYVVRPRRRLFEFIRLLYYLIALRVTAMVLVFS